MENNSENLKSAGNIVLNKLIQYLEESRAGKTPVVKTKNIQDLSAELNLESFLRKGLLDETRLDPFLDIYFENTQHLHHPGFIGHQVAVPHIAGGLADFIHGISNNPMAIYEMGPAASAMELVVINWMIEKLNWITQGNLSSPFNDPDAPAGVMTHGGSLANLTALLAARAYAAPDAWQKGNPANLVLLAPEVSHYCIERAASIMGMGQKAIIKLPVDQEERIIPEKIPAIIREQKSKGNVIVALVANACATSTGYFDDLEQIGKICEAEKIWFHVDAPHGAPVLLSPQYKHLLKGIEYADSVIWDAHKMMKTSALGTAILFKKLRYMASTFQQKGSYIFHEKNQPGIDFINYTIECTKSGIGLKIFWVLAAMGEKGMAQYVENLIDNTLDFYNLINATDGFKCFGRPESNILCFQYKKENINQLALRNRLIEKGNFYITTTEIHGERYLRLAVMNELTNIETIKDLLTAISETAEELTLSHSA